MNVLSARLSTLTCPPHNACSGYLIRSQRWQAGRHKCIGRVVSPSWKNMLQADMQWFCSRRWRRHIEINWKEVAIIQPNKLCRTCLVIWFYHYSNPHEGIHGWSWNRSTKSFHRKNRNSSTLGQMWLCSDVHWTGFCSSHLAIQLSRQVQQPHFPLSKYTLKTSQHTHTHQMEESPLWLYRVDAVGVTCGHTPVQTKLTR